MCSRQNEMGEYSKVEKEEYYFAEDSIPRVFLLRGKFPVAKRMI